MAKWFGKIGFATTEETRPGVWREDIIEKEYFGDMIRTSWRYETSQVNEDINVSHQISIVADPFACENFHTMKWVEIMGSKWRISSVEHQYPRLTLSIGGLYNDCD